MRARRRVAQVFLIAAGLTTGACATHTASLSDLPSSEFTGHYVSGPGESWFRPCDGSPSDPSWWVTLTGQAIEQVERARGAVQSAQGQPYFVRWRAAVSLDGQTGPRGRGVPALLVRELIELRAAGEDDCSR